MPELSLVATPAAQQAKDRRRQMLRTAFGPTIAAALADPTVLEVTVNPDGRLWIDRATGGRTDSGERLGAAETERIIRLVAAHVRREVTDKAPIVSAELPDMGERFEGVMPPVATAPCFSIRKTGRGALSARRLRGRAHPHAAAGKCPRGGRAREAEHRGGRRHVVGQDDAGERAAR
jgi:Flp pilus assembly CpaF family ATPase